MNNIQELFAKLFEDLVEWDLHKITYSNQEVLTAKVCYYNNYKISFQENQISTIFKDIPQTYREHKSLDSIVKEISENRLSFGSFMMF